MQRLIKNGELSTNPWQLANTEGFDLAQLKDAHWLLPLDLFLSSAEQNLVDYSRCGVLLSSDQDIAQIKPYLEKLTIIALEFSAFADGRSFSQARALREQYDFTGEIRAVGEFIQDQLFYLSRCGVNAFVLPQELNIESAMQSLTDFSESYQAACDEAQPLYRRRT